MVIDLYIYIYIFISISIYTIGAKKIDGYKKKVARKQNLITFFVLEIGQKFKQV
jgi:hypothetical protein